ncbi:hypothetical protein ABZ027_38905 [Streptomyces sp. NPDC006332]|uniref:hypothetical protein n=1 Tax=Streptomyces sp. NPDC006332 TaxID=3155456 RepID=UPI0033B4B42E
MATSVAARESTWARTRRRLEAGLRSRPPRSPWRARAKARIAYLEVQLSREKARPLTDDRKALLAGTAAHLGKAASAADETFGWRRLWSGSTAEEGVWSNLRSADVLLFQLASEAQAAGRVGEIMTLVKRHLDKDDPQRVGLALRIRHLVSGQLTRADRELLARALDSAYTALDAELARVRSLRNILWTATFVVLLGVAGLALYGWFFPRSLSLCFAPKLGSGGAGGMDIVCPSKEYGNKPAGSVASSFAQSRDILTVEIAGLAGAAFTVIASLRHIRGTSAPYKLPLASAVLKFPTGALSAFLGVLLIRGAFVPGFSDLDNRAQILAWAAVFGAAQHLVTRLVDDRAQMTLSEVGRPTDSVVDPESAAVMEGSVREEAWTKGAPAVQDGDGEGPHKRPVKTGPAEQPEGPAAR